MGNITSLLLAFNNDLIQIVAYISMVFGGLVIIYALYLGFLMATASDASKRAEAKRRVINSISIILILVALISLLQILKVQTEPKGWVIEGVESGGPTEWHLSLAWKGVGAPGDADTIKTNARFSQVTTYNNWDCRPEGLVRRISMSIPPNQVTIQCQYDGITLARATLVSTASP
jgi:hypothetical protein